MGRGHLCGLPMDFNCRKYSKILVSSIKYFRSLVQSHLLRLSLAAEVRQLNKNASVQKRIELEDRRQKLQVRIESFLRKAERFVPADDEDDDILNNSEALYQGNEWDTYNIEDPDAMEVDDTDPLDEEGVPYVADTLPLPSSIGIDCCKQAGILDLAEQELQLRYGQANDTLYQIHLALGYKSHLYRESVRKADSQRQKLRSFDQVSMVKSTVQINAQIYSLARQAMISLKAPTSIMSKYRRLEKSDLKVTTALINPQAHGLGSASSNFLGWIWTIDIDEARNDTGWMSECKQCWTKYSHSGSLLSTVSLSGELAPQPCNS